MLYEIALILVIIGSIVLVIMENRKPYISLFWVVMLAVLPGVGLVLYLLLGKDYRSRRVIKADELAQLDALRNQAVGTSITELPDGDKYAKLAAMMRNANDSPIFADNQVRIFTDFTPLFQAMLDDIAAGRKYMKVYKQMKMYNDPNLNPVLYGGK